MAWGDFIMNVYNNESGTNFTVWETPGGCTYNQWPETYDYTFLSECMWWYNWEGIAIVSKRAFYRRPEVQVGVTMILVGVLGLILTPLSVLLYFRREDTKMLYKIYLLAASILSIIKSIQMFYNAECVFNFDEKGNYTKTYHRFSCLNTINYPYCGFFLNQMMSAIGTSLPYGYHIISWGGSLHRYFTWHFDGDYAQRVSYLAAPIIVTALGVPPVLLILQQGTGLDDYEWTHFAYIGSYFHPINFVVSVYYINPNYNFALFDVFDRTVLGFSCIFLFLNLLTMSRLKSMKRMPLSQLDGEVSLQTIFVYSQIALISSWVAKAFLEFVAIPRLYRYYHTANLGAFICQNVSGWMINIVIPFIVTVMNSTIDTVNDIPETTTYFSDHTTPEYVNEYEWVYYYGYYGIPTVNEAITCHRLLHYMVVINRLLATHFQGRFFSFLGRVDGLMVFICVVCGALPWFLQIGPGHPYMAAEGQYGNLGAYFNPLTFRIGQYWPYEGYATWGPMANKISILIDIFIVVAEVKSLRKLKKMFRENPCNYIDVRYQKFLCIQHPMLILAWLMDIIFYDVFCVKFPTQYNYAKMHMFLLEHMPGWFLGICGSITVILMNRASTQREKPANSKSTSSKRSHNTGSTTFAA
ncbi:unnamed protein product, partial [Mesorhabditis spiculigera]